MTKQKTLTISIPTWNRASLLNELLSQITSQIVTFNLEDEIEIVVSDNCSTDNTESVVLNYCQIYSFINFTKNESNLGAKSNVIKSLVLANGKFVLLLGDDDRIRTNCLPEILHILKSHSNLSLLLDQSKSKIKIPDAKINLEFLLSKFYWYMGNAGLFICSTKYIKYNVEKYGIDFFNECWPQTQLIILGNLIDEGEINVINLNIPIESKHEEVMIYTSFYLWRTCILELYNAAHNLQSHIPKTIFNSCRNFMRSNIKQVYFNILQCGIFVDLPVERKKTQIHIFKHLKHFSSLEKKYLSFIVFIFKLPTVFSRPLSNIFIFLYKGFKGIEKKNTFVENELNKRKVASINSLTIRKLDFEI